MKSSIWLPLVAGLAAGVFALYQFLGIIEQKNADAKKAVAYETVVIAQADIPYASTITAEMITAVQVVMPNPIKGTVAKVEDVAGRVSAAGIVTGAPILSSMIAPKHTPPGAQHQIKPGHRPVTVVLDSYTVEHLLPGDRVDVLFAEKGRSTAGMRTMKPILQNAEVFAVGDLRPGMMTPSVASEADKKKDKGTAAVAPLRASRGGETPVQLLLPTDKAQKLSVAILNGEIQLLQRAFGDDTLLPEEMELEEVMAAGRTEQAGEPGQQPVPVMVPVFNVVKVLQGGEESEVPFQVGEAPASAPAANNVNKPKSPQASQDRAVVPDVAERALREAEARERDEGDSGE